MSVCLFVGMCTCLPMPTNAGRGCWIPRACVTSSCELCIWVLGTELGHSQPPVSLVPGDLMPSSGLGDASTYLIHRHMQATHSNTSD